MTCVQVCGQRSRQCEVELCGGKDGRTDEDGEGEGVCEGAELAHERRHDCVSCARARSACKLQGVSTCVRPKRQRRTLRGSGTEHGAEEGRDGIDDDASSDWGSGGGVVDSAVVVTGVVESQELSDGL